MPGFRITNLRRKCECVNTIYAKTIVDTLTFGDWEIVRSTLAKFLNDKIWYEDQDRVVVLEGVVLNSDDLLGENNSGTWMEKFLALTEAGNVDFLSKLEGPISGAIYYKKTDKWVVFTGKLGEKAIFYYCNNTNVVVGSQINYVTDIMHINEISVRPDERALVHLMAYGSYIGTETCIDGVKRLYPGQYIIIDKTGVTCGQYELFDYEQDNKILREEEYIELLDASFKRAMKRILKKNSEYGYTTIADISGGYDSRLNCYVIKDLGASNVLLDCYAQSGSHDSAVSCSIAGELGYDYVFRSLDNASCMYNIDENVIMLNGASIYSGITGGRDMLHMLSGLDVGLEITGLLGDVHDGSMVTTYSDGNIDVNAYRDSRTLVEGTDYIFPQEEEQRFKNHVNEHFWFYNRGMICGMSSFFIRQNFTEAVTPFGDSDFIKVYLSIPWENRVKEKLLRKWMLQKYPAAGKYTNSRNGLKLAHDVMPAYNYVGKIIKQMKKMNSQISKGNRPVGMNDFDYWYSSNVDLRNHLNDYIQERKSYANQYDLINKMLDKLIESGSVLDKLTVVTVLSIIKNFVEG